MNLGFALALLGQAAPSGHFYLSESRQWTRIHPLMIQPSGTGKDPAFDLAKTVAREAGMQFLDSNNLTNARFVGTYNDEGELEPGIAKTQDIVGFREATQLFGSARQTYNEGLLTNVNNVIDGKEVTRPMADGIIKFTPECSIVGTSYIPDPDEIDVSHHFRTGTLSRFYWTFRDVTREDRRDDMIGLVEGEEMDLNERYAQVERLAETLVRIQSEIESNPRFEFEADERRLLDQISEMQLKVAKSASPRIADLIDPAMPRYQMHTFRIACLMAALNECSTVVTDNHAETALRLVERSWRELIEFVSRYFGQSKEGEPPNELRMAGLLKSADEPITQKEVLDALPVGTKRSVRRYARRLERVGLIEIDDGRGTGPTTYKLV